MHGVNHLDFTQTDQKKKEVIKQNGGKMQTLLFFREKCKDYYEETWSSLVERNQKRLRCWFESNPVSFIFRVLKGVLV